MNFVSLIEAKRDGRALQPSQIREVVEGCSQGSLPDYQLSAFLMAVFFRGLNEEETRALTLAMRDSGEQLRWPTDPRPVVDKHSTGGIGDKVSLPLVPLLACLGLRVPMISGRGLGITGGTLDKLESIPGFCTALPAGRIIEIVQETGCVICGQTNRMAPADRALYALRDVTGTVPSIPLIVASILSKKLAEGISALVLDVKFGAGAFMCLMDHARNLARAMVGLGNECGVRTRALLTNMNVPLGRAVGNWLEVVEAVECLEPHRARSEPDLRELVLTCAASLLVETGKAESLENGRALATACLDSGEPRKRWDQMLAAQGANLEAFYAKLARGDDAPIIREVIAEQAGFVAGCDARMVGEIIRDLGGGRLARDSVIDPAAGVDCLRKPGESVARGSVLARIHASNRDLAETALARLRLAYRIAPEAKVPPLIAETICSGSDLKKVRSSRPSSSGA